MPLTLTSEKIRLTALGLLFTSVSACTLLSDNPVGLEDSEPGLQTFLTGGAERGYLVHVPDGLPAGPVPLLLAFHGAGQTPTGLRSLSKFDALANQQGFVVAYPKAHASVGTWAVHSGWLTEQVGIEDLTFVRDLIARLDDRYGIDRNRVYAVGLSNGGQFVHRMGCELPDQITAIASVAGQLIDLVADNCAPSRPVPSVFFHGTNDPILQWAGAQSETLRLLSAPETFERWAELNGCTGMPAVTSLPDLADDFTTVQLHEYASCTGGVEVNLYEVVNGGHTWPGSGSEIAGLGRASADIDASELVVEFFLRFTK